MAEYKEVPLNKIKLSRNSRIAIDPQELSGLMQSIQKTGLLQPIGLVKRDNAYEIMYGNRRFLAASKLGWSTIAALVSDAEGEFDVDIKNLAENVQRRQLSLEEIGRYILLLQEEGLSKKETAVRLGVSDAYIKSATSAFSRVPEKYRDKIEVRLGDDSVPTTPGKIPMRIVNALISVRSENRGRLSAEQLEKAFEHVKRLDNCTISQAKTIATAIAMGVDPNTHVQGYHRMSCMYAITHDEYERIYKKYISDGPFENFHQVQVAILNGQISEQIKMISHGQAKLRKVASTK